MNIAKLWQQRQSIEGKVQILAKLDEEILDLVEEDGLEAEIEQADIVKEKLTLCIIDIDQAIELAEARRTGTDTPTPAAVIPPSTTPSPSTTPRDSPPPVSTTPVTTHRVELTSTTSTTAGPPPDHNAGL